MYSYDHWFYRDTKALDNGRVQQLGIKIALFNVADVKNPIVADDIELDKAFFFDSSSGVHSEALHESLLHSNIQ